MKFVKWFYENLGNSKKERFLRLMELILVLGVLFMLIINVGYERGKGVYWKPANVSFDLKK